MDSKKRSVLILLIILGVLSSVNYAYDPNCGVDGRGPCTKRTGWGPFSNYEWNPSDCKGATATIEELIGGNQVYKETTLKCECDPNSDWHTCISNKWYECVKKSYEYVDYYSAETRTIYYTKYELRKDCSPTIYFCGNDGNVYHYTGCTGVYPYCKSEIVIKCINYEECVQEESKTFYGDPFKITKKYSISTTCDETGRTVSCKENSRTLISEEKDYYYCVKNDSDPDGPDEIWMHECKCEGDKIVCVEKKVATCDKNIPTCVEFDERADWYGHHYFTKEGKYITCIGGGHSKTTPPKKRNRKEYCAKEKCPNGLADRWCYIIEEGSKKRYYDPDISESYCHSCDNLKWNIGCKGGDCGFTSNKCCGDDNNEYEITCSCENNACTCQSNDKACCAHSDDCVWKNKCYKNGDEEDIDGDNIIEYCDSGIWKEKSKKYIKKKEEVKNYCKNFRCPKGSGVGGERWCYIIEKNNKIEYHDPDETINYCISCDNLKWNIGCKGGDCGATPHLCCGDDYEEHIISCSCEEEACRCNSFDKACCAHSDDCVWEGSCYKHGTEKDIDNDYKNEVCINGKWRQIEIPSESENLYISIGDKNVFGPKRFILLPPFLKAEYTYINISVGNVKYSRIFDSYSDINPCGGTFTDNRLFISNIIPFSKGCKQWCNDMGYIMKKYDYWDSNYHTYSPSYYPTKSGYCAVRWGGKEGAELPHGKCLCDSSKVNFP